jgi:hypothetical protein
MPGSTTSASGEAVLIERVPVGSKRELQRTIRAPALFCPFTGLIKTPATRQSIMRPKVPASRFSESWLEATTRTYPAPFHLQFQLGNEAAHFRVLEAGDDQAHEVPASATKFRAQRSQIRMSMPSTL